MSNMTTPENTTNPIAQLGHPVLRTPALPVEDVHSNDIKNLIAQMMETVKSAGGVGIAAPQIYHSKQIFIMCSKPNKRYPNAPDMEPTAIINPKILSASKEQVKDWEGCLSVPSMRGWVPRHQSITVSYSDIKGENHQAELTGFLARIFQHELDHLQGLTFIDRLDNTQDLICEQEWQKRMQAKTL